MKLSCSLLYFAALGQLHHFGTAATTESYPGGSNQVSWYGTSTSEIRHVGRPQQWEKYVVVWGTRRVRYFPLSGAPYIHRTTGRGILRPWGEPQSVRRGKKVLEGRSCCCHCCWASALLGSIPNRWLSSLPQILRQRGRAHLLEACIMQVCVGCVITGWTDGWVLAAGLDASFFLYYSFRKHILCVLSDGGQIPNQIETVWNQGGIM